MRAKKEKPGVNISNTGEDRGRIVTHRDGGQMNREDQYDVGYSTRKGGLVYQLTHAEESNLAYLYALNHPENFRAQVGAPAVMATPRGPTVLANYQLSGAFAAGTDGNAFFAFYPPNNIGINVFDNNGGGTGVPQPNVGAMSKVPHSPKNINNFALKQPVVAAGTMATWNSGPAFVNPGTTIGPNGATPAGPQIEPIFLPPPDIAMTDFSSAILISAVLHIAPMSPALLQGGRGMIGRGAQLLYSVPGSFVNNPTFEGIFQDETAEVRVVTLANWPTDHTLRCTYDPRAPGSMNPIGTAQEDSADPGAGTEAPYAGYPGMFFVAQTDPAGAAGNTIFEYQIYCTYEFHSCAPGLAATRDRADLDAVTGKAPMPPMLIHKKDIGVSAGNLAISHIAEGKAPGFVNEVKKGNVGIPEVIQYGSKVAEAAEAASTVGDIIGDIAMGIGAIFGLAKRPKKCPPITFQPTTGDRFVSQLSALTEVEKEILRTFKGLSGSEVAKLRLVASAIKGKQEEEPETHECSGPAHCSLGQRPGPMKNCKICTHPLNPTPPL